MLLLVHGSTASMLHKADSIPSALYCCHSVIGWETSLHSLPSILQLSIILDSGKLLREKTFAKAGSETFMEDVHR